MTRPKLLRERSLGQPAAFAQLADPGCERGFELHEAPFFIAQAQKRGSFFTNTSRIATASPATMEQPRGDSRRAFERYSESSSLTLFGSRAALSEHGGARRVPRRGHFERPSTR